MGSSISAGRDNNDLVEKLIQMRYLRTYQIQRVFRAIDRGDYFLPNEKHHAYADLAWKSGLLHLSAPCIYCDVMEALKLKPGLSFLNLGSGTGYLSTMAGLILGSGGINHGVELHESVVQYANKRLEEFILNSAAVDEFDYCVPKFVVGNCLCLPSTAQLYDRVYCGAGCPKEHEDYFRKLIKVGGILVMPLGDNLLRIRRISEDEWVSKELLHVSFSTLIIPKTYEEVDLPVAEPPSLQLLCRSLIRKVLRDNIAREKPVLAESFLKKKMARKVKRRGDVRGFKTLCLAIQEENSDSDDNVESFQNQPNMEWDTGSHEMNALLRLVLNMGNRTRFVSDNVLSTNRLRITQAPPPIRNIIRQHSSTTQPRIIYGDMDCNRCTHGDENESPRMMNRLLCSFDNLSDLSQSSLSDLSDTPGPSSSNAVEKENSSSSSSSSSSSDLSDSDSDASDCPASFAKKKMLKKNVNNKKFKAKNDNVKKKKTVGEQTSRGKSVMDNTVDDEDGILLSAEAELFALSESNAMEYMDTSSNEDLAQNMSGTSCKDEPMPDCTLRKRPLPDDHDTQSEKGDSSDSECEQTGETQSKAKRKSPPSPTPYDTYRKQLSEVLQYKVKSLSLPPSLKKFVNMNRNFPD